MIVFSMIMNRYEFSTEEIKDKCFLLPLQQSLLRL